MGRPGKFVKIGKVLQGEIAKVSDKQNESVKNEDYSTAALYKGFKDVLNLLYDITIEKEKDRGNICQ